MGVEVVFVQVIDGPWGPLAYGHGRLLGCDEGVVLERRLADHVLLLVWGIEVLYGELEIGGRLVWPFLPKLLVEGLARLLFFRRGAERFTGERTIGLLDHRLQFF